MNTIHILDIPLPMNTFIDIICDAVSDTITVQAEYPHYMDFRTRTLREGLKKMGITKGKIKVSLA
jgi:hypothetical protein